MEDTLNRFKNPENLARLGKQLRSQREQARIVQSKVRGMRQATVSKIENGGDVTLDTLISYASSLGLEVALVPIGQAMVPGNLPPLFASQKGFSTPPDGKPLDLLTEFNDLRDE
jgi:transcriptional regulator with XRE-family HTH domain